MIKQANRATQRKLIELTKQYFNSLISARYDDIYEDQISVESMNLLSVASWPLICHREGRLDFLIEPEFAPNPDVSTTDALSLAFQMDIEECRTGLFRGLAGSAEKQEWHKFQAKKAMCFVDGNAAIMLADSPTVPVIMFFVKQGGKYVIDFEAYWLFSMHMRASILTDIASFAIGKNQTELAREFLETASSLIAPYQRLKRLMIRNSFVRSIVTPQRQQELLDELSIANRAKETAQSLEDSFTTIMPLEEYEEILVIISSMAIVMERSPDAFSGLNEESIRQHFLVQLNGRYEGNATGETFNFNGKTDILLRRNNQNLFIAECKFWRGRESLNKTIDQLLDYATWRDTRLAVVIFNRNRDLSKVLSQIPSIVESHGNCIRAINRTNETEFQFYFKHRNDEKRELLLTILVFDVPG
jgi:hypothetical protein